MIDRRTALTVGVVFGANLIGPAALRGRASLPHVEFDLIDLSVWTGKGKAPAYRFVDQGGFLLPEHLNQIGKAQHLTFALSPANAMLLAEYLRFDRHVTLEEKVVGADTSTMLRADARIVTVRWTNWAEANNV